MRSGPNGPVGEERSGPYSDHWNRFFFSGRQYRLERYRTDEWHDEIPSRWPRPVRLLLRAVAVLVLIGGSVLVIAHYTKSSVQQLYLGANEVHITTCQTFGGVGSDVTADLVNPTGSTADLNATVEVDDPAHGSTLVDTVTLVAEDVPGHESIAARGVGNIVNTPPRVTCHVVGIETVPLSP